jgi:lipopolysaccharide export system permease protein
MPLIERYVLRRVTRVFLLSLGALTGVGWITQVLERLDVVTAKGQAILIFLIMTMSVLPAVIQVVAPMALLLAVVITLNGLTSDNELPIIAAAGASPKTTNRPIIGLGIVVMLALAVSYHVVTPAGLHLLRTILTKVRSDLIASLVQDGGFRTLENGLTMHFRERTPDGGFSDVFISDERNPEESRVFSAARGLLVNANGPFLVLQNGDLIQEERDSGGGSVVTFDTYAIDLRQIGSAGALPVFRAVERSTFYLMSPFPGDSYAETSPLKVKAEIYDRVSSPLYVLVFAFVALSYLSRPRTNRQDRRLAVASVVLICLVLRAGGYAAFAVGRSISVVTPLIHVIPVVGLAFGIYATMHDRAARLLPGIAALTDTMARARKRTLARGIPDPA